MSGPDTAVADLRTQGPDLTGRARVGAAGLFVGAVLVAAALSLHLRGGAEDVAFVQRIETAPDQWLIGHVLMAVGGVLLALGFPSVLRLARDRAASPSRSASPSPRRERPARPWATSPTVPWHTC